ncbi:secretin N-terminal domain-containing protein [Nitratiruptor sp. YY09-18]|uniref:secretin N-terminal domain-containing protein n=1 Tax=Nitratiruptor sp. YY09-18 TaxID=2724901 RepID=UPI0018EC787D|nr:secretin N-terminal domain-containing protein [Nitratiruptor sp. YY09-18]BCD68951.1 general secretion pathway protein D [Nitratiruptor sp. YY09-18]
MRYIKIILVAALLFSSLAAKEKKTVYVTTKEIVNIKFNNLKIEDFIKMVSKIIHKNILLTTPIPGNINFVSSAPVYKDELFNILIDVLDAKGFTLVEDGSYLKVVRSSIAVKKGLDFVSKTPGVMHTTIIKIRNANVDIVAAKIRQFLSLGGKIITLKEANSMVIADYPKNLEIIKKIARFIDQDPSNKMEIKFIELKNAKASRIVNQVSKMAKATINQKIPINKIEILSDDATNSIILIASRENIFKLLPYIKKLDAKDLGAEQQIAVIPLKNAEAKDMVKTLNELLAKKKYPKETEKPTISVDEEMNSLIVSAKGEDIAMIKKMVKVLDRERPQVYIMAKIIEISENKTKQLGIKYGLEGGKVTSNALYTAAMNLGGSSIVGNALTSMFEMPSNITEGIALGAFVDFLSSEGAAEILSQPSILCINNKESSIYVGKTESVLTSSVQGNSTTDLARNTYKRQDIGLTLKIKPRISSEEKVTIKASLIQEDTAGGQPGLPITTKRQLETTAIVNDGESVILGGLTKAKYDDKETKVPLLGDIPIAGNLFKNREKIRDKVNLVVILTPFIVKNSHDMQNLKKRLYKLNSLEERYYEILTKKLKVKKQEVKNSDPFRTTP